MPRRALFFRPEYDGEERFNSISSTLLTSLANGLEREAWHVDRLVGELASKRGLEDWLNQGGHPLLFVIAQSAGIGSSSPHALLCHGYPTRKHSPSNAVDRCFTADDVSPGARLAGLVAFLFTSRGLGTHTRVAPLAQALLGHRNGGTLAVIGTYEHLTVKPYIAPAIAGSSEKDELPLSEYPRILSTPDYGATTRSGPAWSAVADVCGFTLADAGRPRGSVVSLTRACPCSRRASPRNSAMAATPATVLRPPLR